MLSKTLRFWEWDGMVICASNPLTKESTPPKTKKRFAKWLRKWGKVHQNRKWQGSVWEVAFSHTQFNTGIWQMVTANLRREEDRVQHIHAIVVLCCVVFGWNEVCRKQWLPRNITICVSNPLILKSEHHQRQVPATSQHVYNGTITTKHWVVCIIIYNLVQEACLVKLPLVSWSIAHFLSCVYT